MQQIVINDCFGGFHLSLKGIKRFLELKGIDVYFYKQTKYDFQDGCNEFEIINDLEIDNICIDYSSKYLGDKVNGNLLNKNIYKLLNNIKRDDPDLLKVIQELGSESYSSVSHFKIVEIPDNIEWVIEEYDGNEWVSEKHRTWS